MTNLNVEFDQEVFIKGFELYEDRVARRFPELNLSFLEEEKDEADVGPSDAAVDPPFVESVFGPFESTAEVPELVRAPEAVESALVPSSVTPSMVEILE